MNNNTNNNLNNNTNQTNINSGVPNITEEQPRTMRFDPMTGEPIVSNESVVPVNEQVPNEPVVEVNTEVPVQDTNTVNNVNDAVQIQNELQSIPTVEQGKEAFINNVQSMNQEKKEEKKEGVNFVFIIVLFVVILAAIFFLFPLLLDYI